MSLPKSSIRNQLKLSRQRSCQSKTKKGIKRSKTRKGRRGQSLHTANKDHSKTKMKESLSDINLSKDTKERKIMRIVDTRKNGMEPKGMIAGIKTIQITDTATINQSTREIGTMENNKITGTAGLITKTTSTATTHTSKRGSTTESSREDMEVSNKATDTMIGEGLNSTKITQTSSLRSLAMMMKKVTPRSTS